VHPSDLRASPPVRKVVRAPRRSTIIVLAAVFVAAVCAFVFKVSGGMIDFEVYWRAGMRAAAAEPLYRTDDGHYQFKYLPAFAVLVAPLSRLGFEPARVVWFGTSVVLLVVLFRTSLRLLPELRKPPWMLVALTVVVMGKFSARELLLGQANLPFVAAGAGAVLALVRGRDATAGALVALSIVFKPYGVILIPWLVACRRWTAAATAGAGLAAALLLPVVVYAVDGTLALHREWWRTVVSTTAPNLLSPDNVSWLAMYTRWVGGGSTAAVLATATALGCAGAGLWAWSRRASVRSPDALEGALILLVIPLLSPQGWDYVLLMSLPAVMILINYEERLPRRLRWATRGALAVVGLATYDVLGRERYMAFMNASGITLCYFVIIAALVTLRWRRIA
jgi:alpha-1,2-mannosyltransferase